MAKARIGSGVSPFCLLAGRSRDRTGCWTYEDNIAGGQFPKTQVDESFYRKSRYLWDILQPWLRWRVARRFGLWYPRSSRSPSERVGLWYPRRPEARFKRLVRNAWALKSSRLRLFRGSADRLAPTNFGLRYPLARGERRATRTLVPRQFRSPVPPHARGDGIGLWYPSRTPISDCGDSDTANRARTADGYRTLVPPAGTSVRRQGTALPARRF